MKEIKEAAVSYEIIDLAINLHTWAATGVSDYPPRDPLVGQSRFFHQYRQFIRTVDQDSDNFAHVFAVIGEWGRGKSRLGHELVSQTNDCSQGWYVRNSHRILEDAALFDDDAGRDGYLALYIRYSQVASDYQNSDNWFGFGLYKALLPLATKKFDDSIQSEIAKQALRRLSPMGFEPETLAHVMQLDAGHSEEDLYYDANLVTELVQAAYAYLHKFGIDYILVVLDELETVAEAATFGLEQDEAKRLDGQAIRLIGKAIKEEDPRRKLPWLRYVALCSPLLGQQLREIQSTARRFELVELENNAFADVADYVKKLGEQRKLRHRYPPGLVEAAYAMSGANFGWFNVIMANVDVLLDDYINSGKPVPGVGELFDALLKSSGRVARYILDYKAIEGINTSDRALLEAARSLLFGQLPLPLAKAGDLTRKLTDHQNEYDEPVASLYRKVTWDRLDCRNALVTAKFQRDKEEWFYPSVDQGLSLEGLLENLQTFAIHEREPDVLLVPLEQGEFKHLVQLLYNHPAAEYAADALWQKFFGPEKQLEPHEATHIGPSVAMLLRLDLRYRSQQQNSMIFRDPAHSDKHSQAMEAYKKEAKSVGANKNMVCRTRLTGLYRLLDRNWEYADLPWPNKVGLTILTSPRANGRTGGLMHCDGLKLHPKRQAWFAWVDTKDQLDELHDQVAQIKGDAGRIPVMAFTASIGVNDYYVKGLSHETLRDDILLYHLNSSEVDVVERIGLLPEYMAGFELKESVFTSKFKNRLNNIRDFAYKAIHQWRQELSRRGLIAWPLRPTAKINSNDRRLLAAAWRLLCIDEPKLGGLYGLTADHGEQGVDVEALSALLGRLQIDPTLYTQGYEQDEQAGLFNHLASPTQAQASFPTFLARIANPAKSQSWDYKKAQQEWYWGYLWSATGLNAKNVFDDWMWLASEINLLKPQMNAVKEGEWITVNRAGLENAVTEAENWLDGDSTEGYKAIVNQLEKVYGSNRIRGLFAPRGSIQEGTQTTHALEDLERARKEFDLLKCLEEQELGSLSPERAATPLAKVVKARGIVLKYAAAVYSRDFPRVTLDNFKTVNLEDRTQSLHNRIEKARLFAQRVELCDRRVGDQVQALIEEIHKDPGAAPPFPQRLFTLSLASITHIFDGVLRKSTDGETAKGETGSSSDTLLHYLRDLRMDKATERLELLSHEVGYDLATDQMKPLSEIEGYVIACFRNFKQRYQVQRSSLERSNVKVGALLKKVDPPPADYPYPEQVGELAELNNKLIFIDDSFKDLDEKVDEERSRFITQARKGNFSAIKDIPDRLMKPIQSTLAGISGQINTIELKIDAYQRKQMKRANSEFVEQLKPLFKASRNRDIPLMQDAETAGLTLLEIEMAVNVRLDNLHKQASDILNGTGVTVERWLDIARLLLSGNEPGLSVEEQTALVNRGFLRVKVAFGG
ncbi:conserved hypothetical protein [Desulforapulum autotrophicum HRM2]|uniref:Uncharacterized protein n=1 Tax=Desulforapulum autotrophicum (strain ATCC 43914 / DSM 3382 / VKM B-1955 / HRM2) TaxID=177437 RepID=C0QIL0_DESAH|nr:hypothetical protein [Desulforapulum autotrophicum]ACN17954.1 conserved hypothetical protein [Desulforapulum autotrophicum HRM2]